MNNIERKDAIIAITTANSTIHTYAKNLQMRTMELIADYESALAEKNKALNSLREQLNTVVKQRDELKTMNKAHCAAINKLNSNIRELNKTIDNDTSTIAEKDEIIAGLQARIAELAHKEQMGYHNSKQEFVPDFKPFDRVIVSNDNKLWYNRHFSKLCPDSQYPYFDTCETGWKFCKHYVETE